MKKLQLSKKGTKYKGKEAIVDNDVFEIVNQYNWTYCNAGCGYARNVKLNNYLHVYIWKLKNGEIPEGLEIEHIDGNGLNCTISNLRLANRSENCCNVGKKKNNTSGYKGISKDGHCKKLKDGTYNEYVYWRARVGKNQRSDGKTYSATFPYTDEGLKEAIEWQKQMEKELHKEYAFSNRPDKDKK